MLVTVAVAVNFEIIKKKFILIIYDINFMGNEKKYPVYVTFRLSAKHLIENTIFNYLGYLLSGR